MADDSGNKPRATGNFQSAPKGTETRAFTARAPRSRVAVGVVCLPRDAAGSGAAASAAARSIAGQLVNLSSSGMLVSGMTGLAMGTIVEFHFRVGDGPVALSGSAEVVREDADGTGLRFVALGPGGQDLIADLVAAADSLAETPPAPEPAEPLVSYGHGTIRLRLTPGTARFFTFNPLLHIGVGGCFLPAETEVPLGTGFQLDLIDENGRVILRCKTKVAARQERWIGLRFLDVGRDELHALRAELARLSSPAP